MDIHQWSQRLLIGAACAVISIGTQGAELVGKVIAIADGDTITVLDEDRRQHKVRLQAIDAPEKGQEHWRASKQQLAGRVFSQQVTVEYSKADRYGRIVGRVLREGEDINLELLRAGYAWLYRRYAKELPGGMQYDYAAAEMAARSERRGLWGNTSREPPWEWRARERSERGSHGKSTEKPAERPKSL